ncbi:hypothetical protein [Nocardia vinacea]|uniref:hypothetical protein n=1 Tax=Nocardia vinacea TaxID=96468 RepID=UPI00031A214A|nr:hypothetical protein [Nocardia vinacea]
MFDWAVATFGSLSEAGAGWRRSPLARCSLTCNAKGEFEIAAYYLCGGPIGTSDEETIRIAGTRWAIEDCSLTAETYVGLDRYEVRRYDAWYRRHIAMAMLAGIYLAVTAAKSQKHWQRPHPTHYRRNSTLLAHLIAITAPLDRDPTMVDLATRTSILAHYQRRQRLHN